eukprot:238489_1
MPFMATLLWIFCLILNTCTTQPSIFDPRVYNFYYYVQHNPELTQSQIYTVNQAAEHWQSIGIVEGLQACGSFHVLQFINNYRSIINKACPPPQQNYTCAIYYYLNTGFDQNLMGYTIGGAYDKYTISSITTSHPTLGLFTSLSNRMGASIDSIIYQNFEYINAWNHNRNVQITAQTQYGECYQPTESGSIQDNQTNHTTSKIININATSNNIYTESAAAFYMPSGSCNSDDGCGCARNKANVSDYKITKNIYLKYGYQNCFWVNYVTTIYVPEDLDVITIKAPTVSVNSELNSFWKITDNGNSEIFPINIDDNGGKYKVMADGMGAQLLVQATNDTKHAIAVMPVIPQTCNGGIWIENNLAKSEYIVNASSVQYLVFTYYNVTKGTMLNLNSIICIGTLQDVQMCTAFGGN